MSIDQSLNQSAEQAIKFRVIFRGFTLQLQTPDLRQSILTEVSEILRADCQALKALPSYPAGLDLLEISIKQELPIPKVWDLIYRLRCISGITYVEPRFALITPSVAGNPVNKALMNRNFEPLPESQHLEWSLSEMEVQKTWEVFFNKNEKLAGQGVKIGLPDTGFTKFITTGKNSLKTKRKEYLSTSKLNPELRVEKKVPEDSTGDNSDLPVNLWHGIATASLVANPRDPQVNTLVSSYLNRLGIAAGEKFEDKETSNKVKGIAPGAELIPFPVRSSNSTSEVFSPDLATAINEAVEQKVDIISLSLGGCPNLAVRRAIINAQREGIIVVAAAGNMVPFVVWPAAYDMVIAVGSSRANHTFADHSSQGSRVDVAAPGESVWCVLLERQAGLPHVAVKQKSGTSLATPLVAGVAALWLSHHGKDKLVRMYGRERIPLVFDKLLRKSCNTPPGWDTTKCGAGIVNTYKLLETPLPEAIYDEAGEISKTFEVDPVIQAPFAFREVDHVSLDRGGIETFSHLFEKVLSNSTFAKSFSHRVYLESEFARETELNIIQWFLLKLFNYKQYKSKKNWRYYLRTFGQELAFHFGTDYKLYKLLETALTSQNKSQNRSGASYRPEDFLDEILVELRKRASDSLKKYLR